MTIDYALLERIRNNDKTLTLLDLGNLQISDADAKELASALKDNKTLTSLDLS